VVPALLWVLPEQLRLQGEDVVEHPIDSTAFETVLRDHARPLEELTQRRAERAVYPRPTPHLGFLEELQAPVEGKLARPVFADPQLTRSPSPRLGPPS
jgi:hypothetical protein